MKLTEEQAKRIDLSRIEDAYMAAEYLARKFSVKGRYLADEAWGPEGNLYLAESSWALMDAYLINENEQYLKAVKAILIELKRIQKPDGSWAIELGTSGVGFKVTEEERKDSAEKVDPPTTAAMLRIISEYQKITKDYTYQKMGEKAFKYLMNFWDPEVGTFIEKEKRKLLDLRSNPYSYHIFFLLGINAWKDIAPEETMAVLPQLLEFVKGTFEKFDDHTMPLIYALHAATLMEFCSTDYTENVIKPRIKDHLVYSPVFKVKEVPGGYFHRDGSRGIVTNEIHMRSCVGIALAMRKYDIVSETKFFQDTQAYKDLSGWIDQMKSDKYYFEYETLPERKKIGYGSPGQYLPCYWILGKF